MVIQNQRPIDPIPGGTPKPREQPDGSSGPRFKELLEEIERLRVNKEEVQSGRTGLDPLGELDQAVNHADRLHQTAMDLKKRLEEAFKRNLGWT